MASTRRRTTKGQCIRRERRLRRRISAFVKGVSTALTGPLPAVGAVALALTVCAAWLLQPAPSGEEQLPPRDLTAAPDPGTSVVTPLDFAQAGPEAIAPAAGKSSAGDPMPRDAARAPAWLQNA
ncbi:MAG: hypothetical protein ACREE7_04240, partial [Dongiaceae bacterium]